MSSVSVVLTDSQDTLLTPYATSVGKTVAALVAEGGVMAAVQNALRAYSVKVAADASVDPAVAAAVLKDQNAIFNAMWNDWNGEQKFVALASAHLAGGVA